MTPQRFQQLRNIFDAALERETVDRSGFIAGACQDDPEMREEVVRLLEAHDATVTLAQSTQPAWVHPDPSSQVGHRLGDYEILSPLGRGGMGTVYLARRADQAFQKKVAIKILRSEAATSGIIRHFQREREILAQLDHPNIARLLDAGATDDGLPYFVMEFVEGKSITAYADEMRLPMPARLDLFRQVCDAVEYAHQRNIVHRDLKPGNVLVTAGGQVKLLDFGIARLMGQDAGKEALTQTGMWMMTPEYASPEQVRGQVAGRESDVYSLGVLLFELLTGHRPYHLHNRIFHEVVRVVCEELPTRPSAVIALPMKATTANGEPTTLPAETAGRMRQTSLDELKHSLSGDLDNIVLKALQKQPKDRYASPMQFRADIDRHSKGERVWARNDSFSHRIGSILSRYRIGLVVLAGLVAAVASGTVSVQWKALWWVGGTAALMGLFYAATDRKIGARIASNFGLFRVVCFFAVQAAGSTLFLLSSPHWFAIANQVGCGLVVIYFLFVWLTRQRSTGPLLLDISTRRSRLVLSLQCMIALFALLLIWRDPRENWIIQSSLLFFIVLSGRQEIRRDGFCTAGRLIRWSRIASWAWEENDRARQQNKDVLALHLHRRVQFLPPVRIAIQAPQRNDVEAILARQLGEWPVSESHSAGSDAKREVSPSPSAPRRMWASGVAVIVATVLLQMLFMRLNVPGARPNTLPAKLSPSEPDVQAAVAAVNRFHDAFSKQQYGDACSMAEPGAFKGITDLSCPAFLEWAHNRLEKVEDTRETSYRGESESGQTRIEFRFTTRYQHGLGSEQFGWWIRGGQITLTSYRIESDAFR